MSLWPLRALASLSNTDDCCLRSARTRPVLTGIHLMLETAFPHLYAQLEGENVESHKDLVKGDGQTSWDHALEKARQEGWLQD